MKRLLTILMVSRAILAPLYADRVSSTFDPSIAGLNLKFDTNSVVTDNFFSPTMLFSPDGRAGFVNFPGSDSVVVFDTTSMASVANLPVGKNPALLAMTQDKRTVVVANTHLADKIPVNKFLGSISLIDVESLAVKTVTLDRVDFGLGSNVVFTPDSKIGFVASTGTDEIVRFQVPEGTEIPPRLKLPGGSHPVRLTMAHNGAFFVAVNVSDQQFSTTPDSVSIVDVAPFTVRLTITPKETHDFLAIHNVTLSLDDSKGIIGDDGNKEPFGNDVAYIFDTSTGEILKRIELGIDTLYTAVTPDGSRFVVVERAEIAVLSTDTLELITQLSTLTSGFSEATNIVFTADSKSAYVASPGEDGVYGIDMETYAITTRTPVGKDPVSLDGDPIFVALTPDEKQVAVLNFVSNTIDFLGKTFAFILPRFHADTNRFTGLALANVGPTPANLKLQALSKFGEAFESVGSATVTNPTSLDFNAGQQVVTTAAELFQNDLGQNPIDGWITADSTESSLIGSLVTGDYTGKKLDVASVNRHSDFSFVFPVVRQNDDFSTELVITNPNFNSVDVGVDLIDQEGNVVTSVSANLDGGAVLARKLKSTDPNEPDFLPEAVGLQGVYLVIRGSLRINALAFYESAEALSVLPGITPPPMTAASGTELIAAQVLLLGGFRTVVSFVSLSDQDSTLVVTLVDDSGKTLATRTLSVLAKNMAMTDLAELFELAGDAPISAWLRVVSSNAGVVASAEIFTFDGKAMSAFPLVDSSGVDFHLADLAQGGGFVTEIALVNPNQDPARVTMDVFAVDGAPTASKQLVIEPNRRLVGSLASIFGLTSQWDGRVRVQSSIPIVGLELFSGADPETLSVVLPQTSQ
ncbi:MAG: hypothetical protein HY644_09875 [Acidobacteria bacterium]|nr:hypothetical protein [Acidobacteriota bacterium]